MADLSDLSERIELGELLDSEGYLHRAAAGTAPDRLGRLLHAWRSAVRREPYPELVSDDDAVAIVRAALAARTRARRRLWVAPTAAAAVLVALLGGVGLGAYRADPHDTLWPITQALYGDHAKSVAAVDRVEWRLASAKRALADGKPRVARAELDAAAVDLADVRAEDGAAQLVDVHDFLLAKADETPDGERVDPAAPLRTDPARPVPLGAALGAPVLLQAATTTMAPPPLVPVIAAPPVVGPIEPRPRPPVIEAVSVPSRGSGGGNPVYTTPASPPPAEAAEGSAPSTDSAPAEKSTPAETVGPSTTTTTVELSEIPVVVPDGPTTTDGPTTVLATPTTSADVTTTPETTSAPPSQQADDGTEGGATRADGGAEPSVPDQSTGGGGSIVTSTGATADTSSTSTTQPSQATSSATAG